MSFSDSSSLGESRPPSRRLSIDPTKTAIFLDVDGTLLDIAPLPNSVIVPRALTELLGRVQSALGGALAIVTGRRIEEADHLLRPLKLAASGVHGCELRRSPFAPIVVAAPKVAPGVVSGLSQIAAKFPGVLVEPKGAGLALHYRLAEQHGAQLLREVQAYIANSPAQLIVASGRKVFEILPVGRSKGTAIQEFLQAPPFEGRRPVMVGDDVGDVPAFETAIRLGGLGLAVAGEHFTKQGSIFNGPTDVHGWLKEIAALRS